MKTMTSINLRQEKIEVTMKEVEEPLEQKADKEDFRTLKENFNQLFKGQKRKLNQGQRKKLVRYCDQ